MHHDGVTYDRIVELQLLLLPVRNGLVLFCLFGSPDRVSFFSNLVLQSLFNQLSFLALVSRAVSVVSSRPDGVHAYRFARISLDIFFLRLVECSKNYTKNTFAAFALPGFNVEVQARSFLCSSCHCRRSGRDVFVLHLSVDIWLLQFGCRATILSSCPSERCLIAINEKEHTLPQTFRWL